MASSHSGGRTASGRGGPLIRWARFAAQHPGKVLIGWVVGLAVLIGIMTAWGGEFADSFSILGTESQDAVDLLQERFPSQAGDTAQIVFQSSQSDAGVTDPAVQARIDEFLAQAAALPEVAGVTSP
jgi:RND superfamily putative drug exporter